jgi:hypothetical protein
VQGGAATVSLRGSLGTDRGGEGDEVTIVDVFVGDNGAVIRDGDTAVFQGLPSRFDAGGFFCGVTHAEGATSVG